jgi:serine/threonine-protein phosphatase 6 regulatory subunit 3
MWAFIQAQPNIVERLLSHLETEPFLDLLVRILHDPMVPDIAEVSHSPFLAYDTPNVPYDSMQWFSQQRLVPRLVSMLSAVHTPDMHVVVTELISRIISMAAPSPGAGVGDGPGAQIGPSSNRFARQLAARESVAEMVGYVLQDFPEAAPPVEKAADEDSSSLGYLSEQDATLPNVRSATSSVVHAIAVIVELIRKNNSDYFEPYLFHTLRNRLIQVQQQQPGQTDDSRKALEDSFADMVDRMGVVHLGPLLEMFCENMEKLQSFLHKPRSLVSPLYQSPSPSCALIHEQLGPVSTTVGPINPLTTERYRICELIAELLHCSNMALLNRPAEYERLYDSEGRLQGGLSAMEELAQVIAMANENTPEDAMDESDDELEPAAELPVSAPDKTPSASGDSDEDMSSDGGNSDEDMDDIAIDEPSLLSSSIMSEPESISDSITPPAPSPSPTPSPGPFRTGSQDKSPLDSPISRPRSSHSRRSLRRRSRRESQLMSAAPIGERLKQKLLDVKILADMIVSHTRARLSRRF